MKAGTCHWIFRLIGAGQSCWTVGRLAGLLLFSVNFATEGFPLTWDFTGTTIAREQQENGKTSRSAFCGREGPYQAALSEIAMMAGIYV